MTFLQYVAKDILAKHGVDGLTDVAVIFPNKRASLFLNEALYKEAGRSVWSPAYFTISDLFRHHSKLVVPDQIALVFQLYNTFVQITGSGESLDHFYSWGQLMLSDFDDIDKNLVEADKLFINLEAWEEMKDFSFLTEQQRKSLEEFFGNVMDDTALQQRFNDIWKYLGQIYHEYHDSLKAEGKAYEGMLYRDVVDNGIDEFKYKHYIFVGFNVLQKVEQKLFQMLKDKGIAEFYWDYDVAYMQGKHEAGSFISKYLNRFPNALSAELASEGIDTDAVYNNLTRTRDLTYISAPTEDIQARYVGEWLRQRLKEENTVMSHNNIAVVLCDEHLLQNVVHSLPPEVKDVNITTGYPLSASPASTLVYALLNLQLKGLTNDGDHYRLKFVNQVLRHPYAKYISDDCRDIYNDLNEHKQYYPSRTSLTEGREEVIGLLFKKLDAVNGALPLLSWMADVLKAVGMGSRETDDPLMHESVFRMYTLLNRLDDLMTVTSDGSEGIADGRQLVSTTVLQRLLNQLIDSTSIPFHGEPALGIQVMGVLETRNLDFDHVLILSCNEGNMPKGVNDASFVPHSLRKAYEMTTVENKVAIYSYYFHSLLQRAKDVTITYNNATDEGKQGEMSRFMLQYLVEKPDTQTVRRLTLQSGQNVTPISREPIEKTGKVAEALSAIKSLSPTAISRYLRCNLQFYYNILCGLREQDNDEEDEIDNATFGNIFHRTAELIYTDLSGDNHSRTITAEAIGNLLKDKVKLDRMLDRAFREKLFKVNDPTFQPHYNGLQLLNRNVLKLYLQRLLKLDMSTAPFDILALEESFYDKMTFNVKDAQKSITIGGQIDRLDEVCQDGKPLIRVIDYKTGRPLSSSAPSIAEIFDSAYVDSKHTVYYLQAFLYSAIIRKSRKAQATVNKQGNAVAPALLFIRQASSEDYNPILRVKDAATEGKKRATYSMVTDINNVYEEFSEGLRNLLGEIFDVDVPFKPTEHVDRCANCVYKDICGM